MNKATILIIALLVATCISAQDSSVEKTISKNDSLFWLGYNQCDSKLMEPYVADNVEFYHDKGGITLGKEALIAAIKNNLCSNKNFKTRREAVPGTVKIFEMKNGNDIYAAIMVGEHYFFNSYDGKPEKREGMAKFTHLWLLKDGQWKMSRILSYDHHEAPQ